MRMDALGYGCDYGNGSLDELLMDEVDESMADFLLSLFLLSSSRAGYQASRPSAYGCFYEQVDDRVFSYFFFFSLSSGTGRWWSLMDGRGTKGAMFQFSIRCMKRRHACPTPWQR